MQEFWRKAEYFWSKNTALAWILVLSVMGLALWAGICPQSPGVSIGLLAGAAGIMSVRPKMHPSERFAWVAVLVTFTVLEMLAIGRADKAAEATRNSQNAAFNAIAEGLKTAISQSKEQYGATITHVDNVLTKTQETADLAKDGVLELTGADSYMVIYPHGELLNGKPLEGKFDLLNVAQGKHPIWDGRIFMKEGSLSDPDNLYKVTQEFDLKPIMPTSLAGFGKSIQPPKTGVTSYNFSVASRGPLTEEELNIQFNPKANRWEYKYEILEPQPFKIDWTPIPYPRIVQLR
jgi:hypothetical protein